MKKFRFDSVSLNWQVELDEITIYRKKTMTVSRFECVSGLSVYRVEIRSVNNLSSSEDCSTDYCQPV